MKNLRKKSNAKMKTRLTAMTADKKDTEALIAKLALEASKDHIHKKREPSVGANENENVKFEAEIANITSAEELENILQKLKFMGAKGKRVLELLKKHATLDEEEEEVETTTPIPTTLSTPLNDVVKERKSIEENLLRQKREFVLKTALKHKELNEEEEENANLAMEEVYNEYSVCRHEVNILNFFFIFFNYAGISARWYC